MIVANLGCFSGTTASGGWCPQSRTGRSATAEPPAASTSTGRQSGSVGAVYIFTRNVCVFGCADVLKCLFISSCSFVLGLSGPRFCVSVCGCTGVGAPPSSLETEKFIGFNLRANRFALRHQPKPTNMPTVEGCPRRPHAPGWPNSARCHPDHSHHHPSQASPHTSHPYRSC